MKRKKIDYIKAKNRTKLTTGDVIRVACEMLEISQAELARRSGIAESNISEIISGKRKIGKVYAEKLAKALQISPGNILFAGSEPRTGAEIEDKIDEKLEILRSQNREIKALVKRAIEDTKQLDKSENRQHLLNNLKLIDMINDEEDITGFYIMAKKGLSKGKEQHNN